MKNLSYEIKTLKVGAFFFLNYSYIIMDIPTKQAAIVDPAWELERIDAILNGSGVKLTALFLTHSHYDHTNLVNPLLKRYNPQVYMSTVEVDYYRYQCTNLHPLQHLEVINLGSTPVTCLVTPGHTAGGTCYLLTDSLFTGDTVFIEGCGLCHADGGSPEQMYESFQMIRKLVHPETRVFPAHSYGKSPGRPLRQVMEENIYFHFVHKEKFVEFRMRPNQKGWFDFK